MSWQTIDTVRCMRCAVFTETDDLRRAPDGTLFCVTCGPPAPAKLDEDLEALAAEPRRATKRSRSPVVIAAAAVAVTVAGFFAAACASQL